MAQEFGFARRGFYNVGIQYGLKGLRQGLISPAQFVDFNSHVGGADTIPGRAVRGLRPLTVWRIGVEQRQGCNS